MKQNTDIAPEYSGIRKAHIEFELNWAEYLSARMEGIVKPVWSVNNRLYEVTETGDKSYILCLMEKAEGNLVDTNDPTQFSQILFSSLGAMMEQMHKQTIAYFIKGET